MTFVLIFIDSISPNCKFPVSYLHHCHVLLAFPCQQCHSQTCLCSAILASFCPSAMRAQHSNHNCHLKKQNLTMHFHAKSSLLTQTPRSELHAIKLFGSPFFFILILLHILPHHYSWAFRFLIRRKTCPALSTPQGLCMSCVLFQEHFFPRKYDQICSFRSCITYHIPKEVLSIQTLKGVIKSLSILQLKFLGSWMK